jgi:DNA-binding NtrC family response regulator
MLRHALEAQGHTVVEAMDEPSAIQRMQQARPVVVLTDLKLPEGDGFGVLRAAAELDPELPVVVMTAYGSIQDAVTAMKEGAMDFLAKPVDPDHLLLMVQRAISQRRMLTDYFLLKQELAERRGAPRIIEKTPSCARCRSSCIARPAPTRPCCWKGRAALAKSCSPALFTR